MADSEVRQSVRRAPVIESLAALAELASRERGLFIRWSADPENDLHCNRSRDGLTGALLPGLSSSPLDREAWWEQRSQRLWVARRLYDYSHLKHLRPPGTRPWIMHGEEVGRGPDNEPLVHALDFVAHVDEKVLDEAASEVAAQEGEDWGPLDRESARIASTSPPPSHDA